MRWPCGHREQDGEEKLYECVDQAAFETLDVSLLVSSRDMLTTRMPSLASVLHARCLVSLFPSRTVTEQLLQWPF